MENEIQIYTPQKAEITVKRQNYIAKINNTNIELKRNDDFGIIRRKDGSAINKTPTLYKQGADKILFAYQIPYELVITDSFKDHKTGYFYYEVMAIVKDNNSQIIRAGVGCANTNEKSNGFAGAFDSANSMLKKAKKRAIVDLALSISGINFTQDIEDEDFMSNSSLITGDKDLKDDDKITSKQIVRIFAIAGQNGITKDKAKEIMQSKGFTSTKDITQKDYTMICDLMEKGE